MDCEKVVKQITDWLKNKIIETGQKGFVVGVSGGIDSAVVSTLCAITGYPVICLSMPIDQTTDHSKEQIEWLKENHSNAFDFTVDLTNTFNNFVECLPSEASKEIALVNTRSRLRMIALYAFSGSYQYIVVGTGNKIEDYGIGFFTKYGDGGVDISPTGSLKKTEIYALAKYLGISKSIQRAKPTDGLWEDGRSDEDQIGATYKELEWAMDFCSVLNIETWLEYTQLKPKLVNLSENLEKILYIYLCRHKDNKHKMEVPPTCHIENQKKFL